MVPNVPGSPLGFEDQSNSSLEEEVLDKNWIKQKTPKYIHWATFFLSLKKNCISEIWTELFELNLFCIQVNNYYPVII